MAEVEVNNHSKLDKFRESNQDLIENDAPELESINSDSDDNYRKGHNSDYESDTPNIKREEGDGQESVPPKKVDDDEDKKNPQYIPKRGTFYEHDDRTLEDEEEEGSETEKKDRLSKKSIWIEKKERWGHDRFNENEQAPKSRTELIGIYGYDIRNEEGPPRARRRRRYGRGPNKYTRTWEDEDAYKPAKPIKSIPKKNKKEEYPPLDLETDGESKEDPTEEVETKPVLKNTMTPNGTTNNFNTPIEVTQRNEGIKTEDNENVTVIKVEPKEIKTTDYRGFTKARQFKNSKVEQRIIKKDVPSIENVEIDMLNLAILKKPQNRPNNIPPRLQNEQKTTKRYSSLRLRSLPETAATTTFNQQTYYTNDYTPPQPQQAILSQPPPTAVLQQIPTTMQQVPVTATAILSTPTQFAAPFPPPAPFISTGVPAQSFIPQGPQIINYVTGQPPFTQPPFQGFPHPQYNAVTPPTELNYQCQGGTTYYSTQNQQLGHAPLPPRQKAAIPIIPPPPRDLPIIPSINPDAASSHRDDIKYEDYYETGYEESNIIVQ